jgi:hypothetical protein
MPLVVSGAEKILQATHSLTDAQSPRAISNNLHDLLIDWLATSKDEALKERVITTYKSLRTFLTDLEYIETTQHDQYV